MTAPATSSSLPCASTAGSVEYIINWKTFSLSYFAKIPQTKNVSKIANLALHLWCHEVVALKRPGWHLSQRRNLSVFTAAAKLLAFCLINLLTTSKLTEITFAIKTHSWERGTNGYLRFRPVYFHIVAA